MTLPHNLPTILRSHGLKVVEIDGWQDRGRPASTGGFNPVGVLCHHTASADNGRAAIPLLVQGRSDLAGPLCQLSLDRQGIVYIVAAGRANHAGVAKASGTVSGGDGNVLYIGIEAQNLGTGEHWPKAQYDAYVLLAAVLSVEITGNSAQTVRAHKETSITGKIDPAGPTPYEPTFDMDKFRLRVAAQMKAIAPQPKPAPAPEDTIDVSILSGRFDKGDGSVSAAWKAERKAGASLLLGTELAGRTDDTIGGDPHYGVLHSDAGGPKSENAVEYAKADWNLEDSKLLKVWDGGGTGRFKNPAYARITVLRSKGNGRELVDIQNHDAAHLFKGSKFFRPGNLARWLKIRNREAYVMRALRLEHPDAAFMLSGDPNASGTFLERYMATHFAGFKAANNFRFGAAWVSGLRRVGPVESHQTPSSDHPIQRVRLAWAKPKKKR